MFPVWLQTHFHSSHHTLCFAEAQGVSVYFHLQLYSLSSRPLEGLVATVFLLAPFACLQRGSVKLGANVMNKCRRAAGPPNLRTPPRSLINLTDISHSALFPISAAVFFSSPPPLLSRLSLGFYFAFCKRELAFKALQRPPGATGLAQRNHIRR